MREEHNIRFYALKNNLRLKRLKGLKGLVRVTFISGSTIQLYTLCRGLPLVRQCSQLLSGQKIQCTVGSTKRFHCRYGLLNRTNSLDYINGWRKILTTVITASFYSLPNRRPFSGSGEFSYGNNEPKRVYILI